MDGALAIVIPAYKGKYFDAALRSLADQTDKNFRLYISDDGSPENLRAIADNYTQILDIVYHRFENNIGGSDLVEHWNRSVKLTSEKWVWLFSDDDVMSPGCVEAFRKAVKATGGRFNLYRFNITMINGDGEVIGEKAPHPLTEFAYDFLISRLRSQRLSAAIEYIFTKQAFTSNKGFVNFPAAWGSDDASWLAFAGDKPIYTIQQEKIYWRASGINVSAGQRYAFAKATGLLEFIKYATQKFAEDRKEIMGLAASWFFESLGHMRGKLTPFQVIRIAGRYNTLFNLHGAGTFKRIFALQFRYTRFAGLFKKWSGY